MRLARGPAAELLVEVTDGMGRVDAIAYNEGNAGTPAYQSAMALGQDCATHTQCLRRIHPVVSSHEVREVRPTGLALRKRWEYHYQDARNGWRGLGWLGFKRVEMTEYDGTVFAGRTTTTFDNATYDATARVFPFAGLVVKTEAESPVASSPPLMQARCHGFSERGGQWKTRSSDAGLVFPYQDLFVAADSERCFTGGNFITRGYVSANEGPDAYGNIDYHGEVWYNVSANQTVQVASRTTRKDFELTPERIAKWQPNLVSRISIQDRRGSSGRMKTWSMGYNGAGLVTSVIQEPDDPAFRLTMGIARKPSGCIIALSAFGDDGQVRSEERTCDSRDMFPLYVYDVHGHRSEFRFDQRFGSPTAAVEPNGIATQWSYDGFGRISERKGPAHDERFSYVPASLYDFTNLNGQITVVATELDGSEQRTTFDAWGRKVRAISSGLAGKQVSQEFFYGNNGRLNRANKPHPGAATLAEPATLFEYDERARLMRVTYPDSSTEEMSYATAGTVEPDFRFLLRSGEAARITSVKDRRGGVAITVEDALGAPITTMDRLGGVLQYFYTASNLLEDVTHPSLGVLKHSTYDRLGRVLAIDEGELGARSFTYTSFGDIRTATDAENRTREFQYDSLGRMHRIVDDAGETRWFYDSEEENEKDRLVRTTSSTGHSEQYLYEPPSSSENRGLLTGVVYADGSGPAGRVDWGVNGIGQVADITYTGSDAEPIRVAYEYDIQGIPVAVRNAGTPATEYWRLLDSIDGIHPTSERTGDGATTTKEYWPLTDRLRSIRTMKDGVSLQDLQYTYDAAGNVLTRIDGVIPTSEGRQESFKYDAADRMYERRVTASGQPDQIESFEYDSIGTPQSVPGVGSFSFNGGGQRLPSSAGALTFSYLQNGNLLSRSGPGVPGGSQSFAYTPFDLPRTITKASGGTTTFDYDAWQQRVRSYDSTGEVRYVSGAMEERRPTGAPVQRVCRVAGPFGAVAEIRRVQGGSTTEAILHTDLIGTPASVSVIGGQAATKRYAPFGETPQGVPSNDVTTGFTGHEEDRKFGLINMRGRIYDPLTHRFLSADPYISALNSQSWSRFSYARNNPLRWVDPTGFQELAPPPSEPPGWVQIIGSDGSNVVNLDNVHIGPNPVGGSSSGATPDHAGIAIDLDPGAQSLGNSEAASYGADQVTITLSPSAIVQQSDVGGKGQSAQQGFQVLGVCSSATCEFGDKVNLALLGYSPGTGITWLAPPRGPTPDMMPGVKEVKILASPKASMGHKIGAALSLGLLALPILAEIKVGAAVAEAAPRAYSVAFETTLSEGSLVASRGAHFAEANQALYSAMQASPELSANLRELGIEMAQGARGAFPRTPPAGWTWHHELEPGLMRLVPREQHTIGSGWWNVLHPEGQGGYAIWGR